MGFESLQQIHGCDKTCLQDPHQQELAALEKSLKDLPLPSSSPSSSSSSSFSVEDGADCACPVNQVAADPLEQVDSFLRDALNSRNRITVLRLEQEIEKFMRNPKQQQLQFKPIPSSYERLATHRVALHYRLQSMAVDCNVPTGSRILLLKTPESRFPSVRLVDIPLDPALQEKSASAPLEKVAIKQRVSGDVKANGCSSGATDSGRMTPVKSVEERKEEYNKARARIFSNGDLAGTEDDENSMLGAVAVEDESASHNPQELMIGGGPASNGEGKDKLEDDFTLRVANRVAIFRDREKDMKDPDYDRNYDRYSQRNSGFGMSIGPFFMHGMHLPSTNADGFSRLDGSGQSQMRTDPRSFLTPHHLRGPWASAVGSAGVGYPNAFYGNYSQGHTNFHSGSDIYFPAQRFAYTEHYGYIDRCQHPCQPGLQCKASFGEVMRQG